jgi:DNA polymerase/3'-5' exonuclease PolX
MTCPEPITSGKQAMKLPGIGKGTKDKIDEFLSTGMQPIRPGCERLSVSNVSPDTLTGKIQTLEDYRQRDTEVM